MHWLDSVDVAAVVAQKTDGPDPSSGSGSLRLVATTDPFSYVAPEARCGFCQCPIE